MPLDPPSLSAWTTGTINYAFHPSADSWRADALNALTTWFDHQGSLSLGTEVSLGSPRSIEFSMGVLVGVDGLAMYPPPIHSETIAGNIVLSVFLDIPLVRASWYLKELILHEIGHAIGFDHASVSSSIMHLPLAPPYLGGLGSADLASLAAIYGSPPVAVAEGGAGLKFKNLTAMVRKPAFPEVPFFPGGETLAWVPTMPSTVIVMPAPAETPDGVITTFTFALVPVYVYYNTTWLIQGIGYSRSGFTIQLLDELGAPFAPPTGSIIRGIS